MAPVVGQLISAGSSPLTRGKLDYNRSRGKGNRLIPAHAGKTLGMSVVSRGRRAHPRSRGENRCDPNEKPGTNGSSPLTRGKPGCPPERGRRGRLIPAHAGKTAARAGRHRPGGAHPRSRGENLIPTVMQLSSVGSSPLTRGKQRPGKRPSIVWRLIPAHAGKTNPTARSPTSRTAHPRSRGENRAGVTSWRTPAGSSPLTRGKPGAARRRSRSCRLIPAHAGKTGGQPATSYPMRAHPRSRGENAKAPD